MTEVKINVTDLRKEYGKSLKVQPVQEALTSQLGVLVYGGRNDNDEVIMRVCSESLSEKELIKRVNEYFKNYANVKNISESLVDDSMWTRYYKSRKPLNEKKKTTCCPPVKKSRMVSENATVIRKRMRDNDENLVCLSEALKHDTPKKVLRTQRNKLKLNDFIDRLSGVKLEESVVNKAIAKAKRSSMTNTLLENLGEKRYRKVLEALDAKSNSVHGDVIVNKKKICEYSTDELESLLEKVNAAIVKLNTNMAAMNEADGVKKLREDLSLKQKLKEILEDEISFRNAVEGKLVKEDEADDAKAALDFKDLNPGAEDSKKKDEAEESDEEETEEAEEDDEQTPDDDEVVELSSVVITLANKESAEDFKSDLIDAGVPEDVIEIESVNEDETDEEEEAEESDEEETTEETEEESEEKAEESVKTKSGKRLTEADEEETEEAEDTEGESEEESEDEEEAEEQYKVVLTDTDYIDELKQVCNDWGVSDDEFKDMIGGDIADGDDEEAKDEESSEESDDEAEEDEDDVDLSDMDPKDIFGDL